MFAIFGCLVLVSTSKVRPLLCWTFSMVMGRFEIASGREMIDVYLLNGNGMESVRVVSANTKNKRAYCIDLTCPGLTRDTVCRVFAVCACCPCLHFPGWNTLMLAARNGKGTNVWGDLVDILPKKKRTLFRKTHRVWKANVFCFLEIT